jgi:anti-sigma regulatory factor (Ser/Thr protein kinase)
MSRVRARGEEIRRFILDNVQTHPNRITRLTADRFAITRQAVNGHLNRLVGEGSLRENGNTRSRTYALAPLVEWSQRYSLNTNNSPEEDVVWRQDITKTLGPLPDNVRDIWAYGFTEIFNNARDHSVGSKVDVSIRKTAVSTQMLIVDDGVGIFRKIQKAMNLLDEKQAVFELSKGKLTTAPDRHSGEGIFFTSRVFDNFDILSGGVFFTHEFGDDEDWLSDEKTIRDGTAVFMSLHNHTARTTKKIFDQYAVGDDYGFNKTVVPVELAQYGDDKLISRSQAKRVMARVDLFKTVVLDFKDVPTIGQAFADEVFRVFAIAHPDVELMSLNTNREVQQMIQRALAAKHEDRGAKPDAIG